MRNLAFAAVLLAASPLLADDVAKHPFQSSVPRGAVKRVVIDIPAGEFTLRNGPADKLSLHGYARRDYQGRREGEWAQQVVNDTTVEFYVSGSEAIVRRRFGANAQSFRAQKFTGVELTLQLPPGIDLEFETTAGEIDIAGAFGNVDVDLRAGEVDVLMPRANVRRLEASCRVGEVRTHIADDLTTREGIFPGKTKYYNAAGKTDIKVHVTAGEVDVTLTP